MRLIHRKERRDKDGSIVYLENEINCESVIIGRGGKSVILVAGHKVSLEHCVLTRVGDDVEIVDNHSVYGTLVNGESIKRSVLSAGDRFEIGDREFEILIEDARTIIIERELELAPQLSVEEAVKKTEQALSLSLNMPRVQTISLLGLLLVLALFLLYPMQLQRWSSWSTGVVGGPHSLIAKDCKACHSTPYSEISDSSCQSCHNLTEHGSAILTSKSFHRASIKRCIDCHQEHSGADRLVHKTSAQCTECHGEIQKIEPESKLHSVLSFEKHPELSVSLPSEGESPPEKVSLDEADKLFDRSNIALNHALHLKSIRGPEGEEKLSCVSCHQLNSDLKGFKGITFEAQCQRCHGLEFDPSMPGVAVPHGEPDHVYRALYSAYASKLLRDGLGESVEGDTKRSRPGEVMPSVKTAAQIGKLISHDLVESEARKAEIEIFTRTGCKLCHSFDSVVPTGDFTGRSLFYIRPPKMISDWMTGARFDHGAHEEVQCSDCHRGVEKSERSEEILMPKLKQCQECHGDKHSSGLVKSECTMCHSYHDAIPLPLERKRSVGEIVRSNF